MDKAENENRAPSLYEIAAKIVAFCDEMDREFMRQNADRGDSDVYDK